MPEESKTCFSYDVIREGEDTVLSINMERCTFPPSLEDSPQCMARTIDLLSEISGVTKIVFLQKRDYEYDYNQTMLLVEIANIYKQLTKERLGYGVLSDQTSLRESMTRYTEMQNIIFRMLKEDPIGAYVTLERIRRREEMIARKTPIPAQLANAQRYINALNRVLALMDKIKLITVAKPYLPGHKVGDRSVYRRVFNPSIKPDFMFTKLMATYPPEAEELDSYNVGDTEVTIFELPETIQYLYHILPPEFKLDEDEYSILDSARKIMAEHKPKRSEFIDPERMREVFVNVGTDLIEELASYKKSRLKPSTVDELTKILVRYTVGFGLIEVLLEDEKIQDVTINAPMGQIPMFVIHQEFDECMTNIIPTVSEAESWASKLRMISGRPLDEANPILDTELALPGARTRVAVIAPPLNPYGLAYALRRHRDKPWTFPLFIKARYLNQLASGILSFLVDGNRTMLVAGTRSAGKTSLLGSILVEIMRKYRIITIEDTLELPTTSLRKLGYNIQPMKVASALTKGSAEVSAEEGIRTTLRLGDSSLIVGEVRSTEAKSLYEAMRVGALANVVAGTIHGDSPYGVYDRVVNDLQVPRTSFKATDIIVVANPVRSADGLHRWRRVTQISEVRKHWEEDPLAEGGFVDLMKYDSATDDLQPTDDLINGDSEILKSIAGRVKEWAGNWDAVWDNITLRSDVKKTLVDMTEKIKRPDLLEAEFSILCNDYFHRISEQVREEVGSLDSKRIMYEWTNWLKRELKRRTKAGGPKA
ncbi:type II/IV secretion system ATPase subunit [Candidatus Woesearchaeota archaeon]|nr:type II/IV secretion system ATPase subunit [Candidatus Woesearchaeota archaeon]